MLYNALLSYLLLCAMHIFYNLNSKTAAGEDVCFCSDHSYVRQISLRMYSVVLKRIKVIVWLLIIPSSWYPGAWALLSSGSIHLLFLVVQSVAFKKPQVHIKSIQNLNSGFKEESV